MENKGKLWTEEEITYLRNNYPLMGSVICSAFLRRNKKSIIKKARGLGVKSSRVRYKYSKELLEPIILTSNSIREVLDKMGLRAAGGNYGVINKYIKLYSIDTKHFEEYTKKRNEAFGEKSHKSKIPLVDILVENSSYNRTELKKRLVSEGLLEYVCGECENSGIWNGKKLSLQLEHKNGVHDDNRLENLIFLCPNCHSQTDTYAGKANKK